jgi:hypothetical protein
MASTQTVSPWAHGIAVFAGVMMIIGGAFQSLEALAAIVNDKYLVVLPNYIYAFDLTVWGWIHLLIGLALLAIGIFLLRGQTWARVAGIIVAAISAIANFGWLPYSPWWALMVIGLDILVIWALASYLRQPEPVAPQDVQPAPKETQATTS